jgi:hypothetical protein
LFLQNCSLIIPLTIRDDKLWLFDAPDSSQAGISILLEQAVISDGALSRSSSSSRSIDADRGTDQLNTFEVPPFPHNCVRFCMVVNMLAFLQIQTASGRVYSLQAKSSGDANMWIRACRQHTAKETENQIMDKAERILTEVNRFGSQACTNNSIRIHHAALRFDPTLLTQPAPFSLWRFEALVRS